MLTTWARLGLQRATPGGGTEGGAGERWACQGPPRTSLGFHSDHPEAPRAAHSPMWTTGHCRVPTFSRGSRRHIPPQHLRPGCLSLGPSPPARGDLSAVVNHRLDYFCSPAHSTCNAPQERERQGPGRIVPPTPPPKPVLPSARAGKGTPSPAAASCN